MEHTNDKYGKTVLINQQRGIGLLDICAKNKAIDIVRLKTYLYLDLSRPKCVYDRRDTLHLGAPPPNHQFSL